MSATIDPNLPAAIPTKVDGTSPDAEGLTARRRTPAAMAFRRFRRNRLAVVGAVVLVAMVLGVLLLPILVHLDPYTVDPLNVRAKPSPGHLLGTDGIGRDVFARLVYGGRVSLGIGLSAAVLAVLIGSIVGSLAGTLGGWVDSALMRAADVFMSFPGLVAIIVIVGIFGASVPVLILLMAFFGWTSTARVVRGMILSLREREYVQAARAFGAKT
ncbi:MAG: ABC transporter permease, partial [Nakamurella sp.]